MTGAFSQAAWRALVRLVYAVPQHRNGALQGIAAMLSRVDSEHSLVSPASGVAYLHQLFESVWMAVTSARML